MRIVSIITLIFGCFFSLFVYGDDEKKSLLEKHSTVPVSRSDVLNKQLQAALAEKGKGYQPRTEHLDAQGLPIYTNRLIFEDSPYLLQHAHNPVDWYAWGEQAFAVAKQENKPIFLSIGYSTCHWCHVMERESFENPHIAELLNKHFVSIKVDRERRPDVDSSYMNAVVMIAGRGGWPMSSFLTPEGKTFFGGTYFPPDNFTALISRVDELWKTQQPQLLGQAAQIATAVAELSEAATQAREVGPELVQHAVQSILARHDELQGGFSQAPKFPNEPSLFLLLRELQESFDPKTFEALENTLDAMAQGGIYDQIAGGFHRYSTDNEWLVPHFEKMLYNQAHLSRIYLQAWSVSSKPEYERVVRQTLDYILREMTASDGGFYSATDADSEGEEGLFFLWTIDEINQTLPADDASLMRDLYQITKDNNFEHSNILSRSSTLEDYAQKHKIELATLISQVDNNNKLLWQKRQSRIAPLRDDKILTAWNAMMITSLAQAGFLLNEQSYSDAAVKSANYLWNTHRSSSGKLWRASLNGKTSVRASQEDYAYLAESFIMLYDVIADDVWLKRAEQLTKIMLDDFWDDKNGGFFMSAKEGSLTPMGRAKSGSDNAIPSGNSVALHVLQKLHRRTENFDYESHANKLLASASASIVKHPNAYAYLLSGAADLNHGEFGVTQYAANGKVKIQSIISHDQKLKLNIAIQDGWHINSDIPLQDYLSATKLTAGEVTGDTRLKNIRYPDSVNRTLGFQTQTLALFEGSVEIQADLEKTANELRRANGRLELVLQACSDSTCLAPETILLSPVYR